MILSHEHRFIFLKTAKTAGTSVEIALSRACGPDDVITPLPPDDEEVRRASGGRGPQHHLAPFREYSSRDWYRLARVRRRAQRFYNHSSASEVRPRVGEQVWSSYFKFCFERNPWDRVLSFHSWYRRKAPDLSFDELLGSPKIHTLRRNGMDLYRIGDEIVVDRVCRYETLADDMATLADQFGLPPETAELVHTKAGYRQDRRPYQDVYTDRQRQRVAELFATEIELFGYEF